MVRGRDGKRLRGERMEEKEGRAGEEKERRLLGEPGTGRGTGCQKDGRTEVTRPTRERHRASG